jgi:hypothetical protein
MPPRKIHTNFTAKQENLSPHTIGWSTDIDIFSFWGVSWERERGGDEEGM